MWPSPVWMVPSRAAQKIHSMKPPARIRAITPNPTAPIANPERRRWRSTLHRARRMLWRIGLGWNKGRDNGMLREVGAFNYKESVSRNLGWVSEKEQDS